MGYFPNELKENFEEFHNFFNNVSTDRQEYYKDLIHESDLELTSLKAQKKSLTGEIDTLSSRFSNTNLVNDVSSVASREENTLKEISDLDLMGEYLVEAENLQKEIDVLVGKRDALLKLGRDHEKKNKDNIETLSSDFKNYIEFVYGVPEGSLEFDYNSNKSSSTAGRTEISCWIPSHGSYGRGKAKIVLFDFVWFFRKRASHEFNPEFLIHDGPFVVISDDVKPKVLDLAISLLNSTGKQYIITANEGDILELDRFKNYICKNLDGSDDSTKFFKELFDDRMA